MEDQNLYLQSEGISVNPSGYCRPNCTTLKYISWDGHCFLDVWDGEILLKYHPSRYSSTSKGRRRSPSPPALALMQALASSPAKGSQVPCWRAPREGRLKVYSAPRVQLQFQQQWGDRPLQGEMSGASATSVTIISCTSISRQSILHRDNCIRIRDIVMKVVESHLHSRPNFWQHCIGNFQVGRRLVWVVLQYKLKLRVQCS